MDARRKSEYANKVKCSTLKSAQPDPVGISEPRKIMLGLSNEDSVCEYEQKSVVSKRKKPRQSDLTKVKSSSSSVKPNPVEMPKPETTKESQESVLLCQEPVTQNPVAAEVNLNFRNVLKPNENSLAFLNDPVPVDDNSKAFMGSLGSWINDLFSTPDNNNNKKVPLNTAPKIESKPFQPVALPNEDSDYLKTINVLKEQFKKKLKSETSVHISNGDKVLQFNLNECGNKKLKKKLKSLHTVESLVKVAFTKDENESSKEDHFGLEVKRQGPDDLLNMFSGNEEKETSIQLYKAKNELNLTSSNLIKEKKYRRKGRSNQRMLEEYVFPVATDLSKRLLLNVDDQDKCSKLYKNSHVGIQENHNAQKSRRSYQNSTRCYTTNATLTENVEMIPLKANGKGNVRHSQSSHSSVSSSGKRKTLGTRNSSTFVKVRSQKTSSSSPHMDAGKIDSKNSSDDLVKYLIKKVKVQHRPQVAKKKSVSSFNQSSALNTGKSKFMQSATSSLVMNVLSKKDGDILLSTKGASRVSSGEKIDLFNIKPAQQMKGWNQKYDDTQARLDVKRVSTQNRLNKSTYLSDDHNDLDSNNLFFGKSSRQLKKFCDSSFKTDSKKTSEKNGRKLEGKVTPVKLDKSSIYKMAKIKPKDLNKKSMPNSFLENYGSSEGKENSSGKFQHQHELFKNSLKSVQQNGVEPESSNENDQGMTNEKELEATLSAVSPISSDLVGAQNSFQLVPEESSDIVHCETGGYNAPLYEEVKASNDDVMSCFSIDDSSLNMSVDQGKATVDKPTSSAKMKSLQLLKEENTSILLSPSDEEKGLTLADLTGLESSGGVNQDVRPIKPFDGASLLNRRLPPNFSGETSKQKNGSPTVNYKTFLIADRDQCKENIDSGKKQSKDKKKESYKKGNVDKGRDCGFEKTNKPGPNCDNEISSSSLNSYS